MGQPFKGVFHWLWFQGAGAVIGKPTKRCGAGGLVLRLNRSDTKRIDGVIAACPGPMAVGVVRLRYVAGFTLLEILLVVAIIALTSMIIVPNFHQSRDYLANEEARRLQALVSLARDEAAFRGRVFALQIDTEKGRYQFLQQGSGKNQWISVTAVDALQPRQLPRGVQMTLQSDKTTATAGGTMLLIQPTGEVDNFLITMRGNSRRYQLTIDQNQALRLVESTPSK